MKQILILTCLLFAATNLQAAPAGPPNSVENLTMSLEATKSLVGSWKTPIGVIELRADGVIRVGDREALWKVDANPHATELITYRSDYRTDKETIMHIYKLRFCSKDQFTASDTYGEQDMVTWTRIKK